jgi:hypothetical protein
LRGFSNVVEGVATLVQKKKIMKGEPRIYISKKVLLDKMDEKDRESSLLEVLYSSNLIQFLR